MTVNEAMVKVADERLRYLVRLFIEGPVPDAATFRLACQVAVGDDYSRMDLLQVRVACFEYVIERLTRCDFPVYTVQQTLRA